MVDMGTNMLFRSFCALADGAASAINSTSITSARSTRSTSGSAGVR